MSQKTSDDRGTLKPEKGEFGCGQTWSQLQTTTTHQLPAGLAGQWQSGTLTESRLLDVLVPLMEATSTGSKRSCYPIRKRRNRGMRPPKGQISGVHGRGWGPASPQWQFPRSPQQRTNHVPLSGWAWQVHAMQTQGAAHCFTYAVLKFFLLFGIF